MKRKTFVHSWGRKIFFGVSWPLSMLVGLIYFKDQTLPSTLSEMLYVALTHIGHYGLLNALVYFFLFAPIVFLMPSYYIARLWSLLLIVGLNSFILLDGLSFSLYQVHFYDFIGQLYLSQSDLYLFGTLLGKILFLIGAFILSILIWFRGELFWRSMQKRFSNPIKNGYLILIILFVILGKLIANYGTVSEELLSLRPLDYQFQNEAHKFVSNRKVYYPKEKLVCSGKETPNVVIFVINNLSNNVFTPETMPHVFHMQKHTVSFSSHMNVGQTMEESSFSLFYSLPAHEMNLKKTAIPALETELLKRNYLVKHMTSDEKMLEDLGVLLGESSERPFSLFVNLDSSNADKSVQDVILYLQKKSILQSTHVMITGVTSGTLPVPLLYAKPARLGKIVSTPTSHYDVMPTLMNNLWGCKNAFRAASVGQDMENATQDWLVTSGSNTFVIQDFKNDGTITLKDGALLTTGSPRMELVFESLKLLNRFNRP